MAKPSRTPAPQSESSPWLAFGLIGLCGVLIGATGMYFLLLPKLQPPSVLQNSAPAAGSDLPLPAGPPSPDLTAGLPPAQADRTLGNAYYDQQNWAQAIHYYESAIKQGSDDADIRTDLGNAYRFTNRPDDALVQYRKAQEMNPAHEFSLFNQGGLFLENFQQPQKATEIWNEYLRRFPQGSNVAAAKNLLARVTLAPGAPAAAFPANHPAIAPSRPSSAEEERLLRLVPAKASTDKP